MTKNLQYFGEFDNMLKALGVNRDAVTMGDNLMGGGPTWPSVMNTATIVLPDGGQFEACNSHDCYGWRGWVKEN